MNYFIRIKLGGEERSIVACSLIDGRLYNVKEILGTPLITNTLYLTSFENLDIPFVVCEVDDNLRNSEITAFYNWSLSKKHDVGLEVLEKLSVQLKPLTPDNLKDMMTAFKELDSYIAGDKVQINMQSSSYWNFIKTNELVQEINNSGRAKALYIEGENATRFMEKDTSELFIKVPSYESLTLADSKLPSFDSVMKPYDEEGFSTLEFAKYIERPEQRILIIGDSQNNDLEIQPNEQRYYNALKSLMDYGIKKEFPDREVEECIKNGIGSTLVKDYIFNIALMGASINWSHTGRFPLSIESELSDDDDSGDDEFDSSGSSAYGNRLFAAGVERMTTFIDGVSALGELMDSVFNTNPYGVIDIAISLLRWGKRKPTRIKLDGNKYLDLNQFRAVTGNGNFNSTKIKTDSKGNNLELDGIIRLSDFIKDPGYLRKHKIQNSSLDLPIGFICRRSFEDSDETQNVLVSIVDVIRAYNNNEPLCKISGITLENGRLRVSNNLLDESLTEYNLKDLVAAVNNNDDNTIVYYCYDDFKDAFMEMECFDRKTSTLSIINNFMSKSDLGELDIYMYETKQELEALCLQYRTTPRTCIEANIARSLIPMICDVFTIITNNTLDSKHMDINDYISYFENIMQKNGYTGNYSQTSSKANSLQESIAFAQTSKEEVKESEIKQTKSYASELIDTDITDMIISKLYVNTKYYDQVKGVMPGINNYGMVKSNVKATNETITGIVVGYIAVRKDGSKYVFLTPNGVNTDAKNSMNISKVATAYSADLIKIIEGGNVKFKFDNIESCVYYSNILKNLFNIACR